MNRYKNVEYVSPDKIKEHPEVPNVRGTITKEDVAELIRSIMVDGVKHPIHCFKLKDDATYYIESGWRRWRAVMEIIKIDPNTPHKKIPVLVQHYPQKTAVRDAVFANIVENAQRKDVNALDMGTRIQKLIDQDIGKQEICKRTGKSITWVNNVLLVLSADDEIQSRVRKGEITMDEARKAALQSPKDQAVIAKGLAAAKKAGNKSAVKKIKKGLDEAARVRSHEAPKKKEIQRHRNVLTEVMLEMKKDKDAFLEKYDAKKFAPLVEYFTLIGCLNMLKYSLGESPEPNFDKIARKYKIDLGTDGKRLKKTRQLSMNSRSSKKTRKRAAKPEKPSKTKRRKKR
jgi:ParB/RepB/Spo0J family partition protein